MFKKSNANINKITKKELTKIFYEYIHIYSNAKEINYIIILQRLPIIPQIEITKKSKHKNEIHFSQYNSYKNMNNF